MITQPAGCQDAFRSAAFQSLNYYRARHGSVLAVRNSSLDNSSLTWATYLAKTSGLAYSNIKGIGENMVYLLKKTNLTNSQTCASNHSIHFIFLFLYSYLLRYRGGTKKQ